MKQNFRISKSVTEYEQNLTEFCKRLSNISETKLSLNEYASFIYALGNNGAVEVMEDDSGVWVEFWKIDAEKVDHEQSYRSYEDAFLAIEKWVS